MRSLRNEVVKIVFHFKAAGTSGEKMVLLQPKRKLDSFNLIIGNTFLISKIVCAYNINIF